MQAESVRVRMVEPSQQVWSNLTQVLLVHTVLKDPTAILILEDSLKDKIFMEQRKHLPYFFISSSFHPLAIHSSECQLIYMIAIQMSYTTFLQKKLV
jgi:hypothetical protein